MTQTITKQEQEPLLGSDKVDKNLEQVLNFNKKLLWSHRIVSFVIAGGVYFLNKPFAQSFFICSFIFNIYLMMLSYGFFPFHLKIKEGDNTNPLKPLPIFISMIRVLATAGLLAFGVLYLKVNMFGLIAAFVIFQIVFIVYGIYQNRQ